MRKKLIAGPGVVLLAAVAVAFLALRGQRGEASRGPLPGLAARAEAGETAPDAPKPAARAENESPGKGLAAIEHAAKAGKYLFIFFYRDDSRETLAMREVFHAAMTKAADRAEWVEAKVTDPAQRALVAKFNVSRAPMPLALAVAPNGAVTGGFPVNFDEEKLLGAFVSPCMAKCLKSLQERKLVFLCVQGKTTKSNAAAMAGVRDFKADSRFSRATEIVVLDPADTEEASFLRRLQIDPRSDEAITAFLAPPGVVIAKFKGATNKGGLVATLQRALASCGSGCGPSGCGP